MPSLVKLSHKKKASLDLPVKLTAMEMKGVLAAAGIAGVFALMRIASNAAQSEARAETAAVYNMEMERLRNRAARAHELEQSRALTEQHFRAALSERGINPFIGGNPAPMIMAAAKNQPMSEARLPVGPLGMRI